MVCQNSEAGHFIRCYCHGRCIWEVVVGKELGAIFYLRLLRWRNARLIEARLNLISREGSERHGNEKDTANQPHSDTYFCMLLVV
jgi:hypothetical protein